MVESEINAPREQLAQLEGATVQLQHKGYIHVPTARVVVEDDGYRIAHTTVLTHQTNLKVGPEIRAQGYESHYVKGILVTEAESSDGADPVMYVLSAASFLFISDIVEIA